MNTPIKLTDSFNRAIDYLRISVTDRCDLRCSYCMPKRFKGFAEPSEWLTFEEITRVVAAFTRLGTTRFRLTGGEPLLRKNLAALVDNLSHIDGVEDLSLSTNGTRLAVHAHDLYKAGLKRINVSLDSLRADCVQQITGSNSLDKVLHGLRMAKHIGFERIKINMVLLDSINEYDIDKMLRYCIENQFILRLIETMPMGYTGQQSGFVSAQPILTRLIEQYQLESSEQHMGGGPARYWQTVDGKTTVGVITPRSQHFCATCNRVRLAVDGTLYLCLGQNDRYELRPMLRDGCTDEELEQAIMDAIKHKPEKHEFNTHPEQIVRFMSMTGG